MRGTVSPEAEADPIKPTRDMLLRHFGKMLLPAVINAVTTKDTQVHTLISLFTLGTFF